MKLLILDLVLLLVCMLKAVCSDSEIGHSCWYGIKVTCMALHVYNAKVWVCRGILLQICFIMLSEMLKQGPHSQQSVVTWYCCVKAAQLVVKNLSVSVSQTLQSIYVGSLGGLIS